MITPLRFFRQLCSSGIIFLLLVFQFFISCSTNEHKYLVFVGTYTNNGSEGIYSFKFNPETSDISSVELAVVTDNPSFIAIDQAEQYLYAVNELDTFNNEPTGAVSVFKIDRESEKLNLIQKVSSFGAAPAHLSLDKSGKFLLVANYNGGNISVFPIGKDGKLGEHSAFIQNVGFSVNAERQSAPHAHFIEVTEDNRFVMVADLGIDKILIFQFDSTNGSLKPNKPKFINLDPGSGPRHFVFTPLGKFFYVLNELASTVTVFEYVPTSAAMQIKQTISTLPQNFKGTNTAAEISIDSKGKFLYASNRGDDSIVQFSIDPITGMLTPVTWISSGGKTPRNFEIDPTGKWLFSANQNSDSISLFKIDQENGRLINTNKTFSIKSPVCVKFIILK
jgi:6-phosphogluconolactonase